MKDFKGKKEFSKWPEFDDDQIKEVSKILQSGDVNYWTGNQTKSFEKEFAELIGSKKGVAIANGTLALRAAYKSLGLSKGDELITTPRTFIATSSTAIELGLNLAFADVDRDSGCITASTIEPLITQKTKAISVVHLGGWPADMDSIMRLSRYYKIPVIEDCSQAHGAKIKDQSVGTFGEVSTWSFCQDKIISTGGEGGMITTSNQKIWKSIWSYKDHGKNYQNMMNSNNDKSTFRWLHDSIGTNMRLTEMQGAIGRIQIKRLNKWNEKRNINANIFIDSLKGNNLLRIPIPSKELNLAWYRLYLFVRPNAFSSGWNRDRVIYEIKQLGVPIFSGSCSEIYLEKCFKDYKYRLLKSKRLPVAKELGETSLCFLVHPTLKEEEIEYQINIIKSVLRKAAK